VKVNGEIREAIFLRRLKRFSALVEMEGKEEIAYLPNTGSSKENNLGFISLSFRQNPGLG